MNKLSALTLHGKILLGTLFLSAQLLAAYSIAGGRISSEDRELGLGKIEATEAMNKNLVNRDMVREQTVGDVKIRIQELTDAQEIIGQQMKNSHGLLPAAGQMITALVMLTSNKIKVLDYEEIFTTMNESQTLLNLMEAKISELQ